MRFVTSHDRLSWALYLLATHRSLTVRDNYLEQRVNKRADSHNKNTISHGDIQEKWVFKPDFGHILQIVCVFEIISFASIVICLRSHSDG